MMSPQRRYAVYVSRSTWETLHDISSSLKLSMANLLTIYVLCWGLDDVQERLRDNPRLKQYPGRKKRDLSAARNQTCKDGGDGG